MPTQKLIRILYISTAVQELTNAEIRALVARSAERNKQDSITGLLCYKAGMFLQVIEGPEDRIRGLMDRLHEDTRHTWLLVLIDEPIRERLFESWNMGLCDLEAIDAPKHAEFRAIHSFLCSCRGLDTNAVVMGLIRHFRTLVSMHENTEAA